MNDTVEGGRVPQRVHRPNLYTESESDDDSEYEPRGAVGRSKSAVSQCIDRCDSIEELEELENKLKRKRIELEEKDLSPQCGICIDKCDQVVVTGCNHIFCGQCIVTYLSQPLMTYEQRQHKCPLCRKIIESTKFMDYKSTLRDCETFIHNKRRRVVN